MTNPQMLSRHAELVDRMAITLGLDLEEKIQAGQLQLETLSDAVLACTGCANAAGCDHWLNMQNTTAATAPDMCRSADMLAMLKAGKSV